MRGVRVDAPDWERYGPSIERLREAALLLVDGDRIRLTDRGVLLSNEVFGEFVS